MRLDLVPGQSTGCWEVMKVFLANFGDKWAIMFAEFINLEEY